MGKKKVEVVEEVVVEQPVVLEGAANVTEDLTVDLNDPRTRSDR